MPTPDVHLVAVLVSGIATMVIGMLWYSPMLFAKEWQKLSGISEKDIKDAKGKMGKIYGTTFLGSLVMAYVMAHVLSYIGATSILEGLQAGFWMWLGFVATTNLPDYLYTGRSIKLYAINAGYHLMSLLAAGVILVLL